MLPTGCIISDGPHPNASSAGVSLRGNSSNASGLPRASAMILSRTRLSTGTLITDNLIPGQRLLLLSTGTGLAPFASLIKDPDVYERFETIVLVHGCRQVSELAYGEELVARLRDDELFGPLLTEKLKYYPTVTREPFRNRGRITDLITSEQLFGDLDLSPLDIETDRIMMCGSPGMLEELRQTFEARGFLEGSHSEPGHFVIEKAFVER